MNKKLDWSRYESFRMPRVRRTHMVVLLRRLDILDPVLEVGAQAFFFLWGRIGVHSSSISARATLLVYLPHGHALGQQQEQALK